MNDIRVGTFEASTIHLEAQVYEVRRENNMDKVFGDLHVFHYNIRAASGRHQEPAVLLSRFPAANQCLMGTHLPNPKN